VTPGLAPTKAGVQDFFRMQRAAFPDMHMAAEDVIASGDKVVARVRYTGTNQGSFMGMPATGKRADVQLMDMFLFGDDGRVREHWGVLDALALMQQLGVVPAGPPA
jgi:predicted ester cyclase